MPLNLYRRHFRSPGKCVAGYEPDFRNYETDELRRGWKKCHCPLLRRWNSRGRLQAQEYQENFLGRGEGGRRTLGVGRSVGVSRSGGQGGPDSK